MTTFKNPFRSLVFSCKAFGSIERPLFQDGDRFFFFSREETRMNIHVISGHGETRLCTHCIVRLPLIPFDVIKRHYLILHLLRNNKYKFFTTSHILCMSEFIYYQLCRDIKPL